MSYPPSVDKLARSIEHHALPWPVLVVLARQAIDEDRVDELDEMASQRRRHLLGPLINGTGVLLHTNLGRAPVAAYHAARASNLELDVASGQRGSRQANIGELLANAAGAEAALVVNNCASALMLCLAALGQGRKVAVSRGELVEIGGGFRVPDVMAQSGAELVEVGTTNRTRLTDFRRAVEDDEAVLALKVHQSNYKIVGFTEEVSVAELASLDVPVIADIGSGLLDSTCPWLDGKPPAWLANEPAARQTLEAGASLVIFSGDKLFGGPQAGIIAGDRQLIERCSKHPLARALRPGGLVLSALQDTTLAYLRRDGGAIEFWKMATVDTAQLEARCRTIVEDVTSEIPNPLHKLTVEATESTPGGGTLPTVTIPSFGLKLEGDLTSALRAATPPLIARVVGDTTIIDLRSVNPVDDQHVTTIVKSVLEP